MKNYIAQYRILFLLTWVGLYFYFPAWRVTGLSFPIDKNLVSPALIIYFFISAYIITRCFNAISIDKPIIVKIDLIKQIRNSLPLVFVCFAALILHLHMISYMIVIGESSFLIHTFWMYDFFLAYWQKFTDIPVQVFFWAVVISLSLFLHNKKIISLISGHVNKIFYAYETKSAVKVVFIVLAFAALFLYSHFFPYISYQDAMSVTRHPPLSRALYLIFYSAFGLSHYGPRILQLIFYILSSIVIYRTICLFRERGTAVLGAAIYLFSPIVFAYASRAAIETGVVLFITLISFYFLRYLKEKNNRDLLLTTYFIGTGFLYKEGILIMFFVCFAYLLFNRIIKRDFNSLIEFKILLLSFIPVLPLKAGPSAKLIWGNLISLDDLTTYCVMLQSQISLIVFVLFVISFIYALIKSRDDLSLFFILIFTAYYLLFTMMFYGKLNHRYAIALYPSIVVLITQFISNIIQRRKYLFKFASLILVVFLVYISLIPRSSSDIITYKYKDFEAQYYPWDKVAEWINNTNNYENILGIYLTADFRFYFERKSNNQNKINDDRLIILGYGDEEAFYSIENLKKYCKSKNVSHIILRYGPKNSLPGLLAVQVETAKYLKDKMDKDSEFTKVATFNVEDNYLLIYRANIS